MTDTAATATAATNDLETIDRARVFHPSTHLAQYARGEAPSRIVTGGSGIRIVDRDGRESIDGFGGLYCVNRSEEHTSELQSLMRISYAVFCLKKKTTIT